MGNTSSNPSPEKLEEEARQKYGVLIPPSFIVVDDVSSMPISCQARLRKVTSPNVLNDLWTLNQGRQLLETYMSPGVTLNVPTATEGQILVSLNAAANSSPASFLWASQPISNTTTMEMLVPTADSPNFQLGYKNYFNDHNSYWAVRGQMNTYQKGWVETRVKTQSQGVDMLLSLSSSFPSETGSSAYEAILKNAQLQAAAEYRQSLVAVHGGLDDNNLPRLKSSMVSINLNNQTNTKVSTTTENSSEVPPPLWLTLKQDRPAGEATKWTLNLSQLLSFDRAVWNVLEERAPKVRQTLGWSLQIDTINTLSPTGAKQETKWSVGGTWQVNRGLAVKGIVSSSTASPFLLDYGVILKRWQHPRATLSILNRLDPVEKKNLFLGFGVELEASPLLLATQTPAYPNEPPPEFSKAKDAAPTKVYVPKSKYSFYPG
eukprot:scaffold5439_cov132-Cylindrotheca_fusiformis.AAC.10